ncbi:MAG: transposase [Balneolales bacterium]
MNRKSSPQEVHFITTTVVNWMDVFIRREYNDFIIESLDYCIQHKGLEVYAYALMTNHLHLIVRSRESPLSSVVRDFKTYTSKQLFDMIARNKKESRRNWLIETFESETSVNKLNKYHQFWQNTYHPVLLFSNGVIKQKMDYVHENPVRAGFVSSPEHYYYSSAHPQNPLGIKIEL